MRKQVYTILLFLFLALSLSGQKYAIMGIPQCWNDSSITQIVLVSSRSSQVESLGYINTAGASVNVSGGTLSLGSCDCCGGSSTGSSGTTPDGSIYNRSDILSTNRFISGDSIYSLSFKELRFFGIVDTDSLTAEVDSLIIRLASNNTSGRGAILIKQDASGKRIETTYGYPQTEGFDGQGLVYDALGDSLKWVTYATLEAVQYRYAPQTITFAGADSIETSDAHLYWEISAEKLHIQRGLEINTDTNSIAIGNRPQLAMANHPGDKLTTLKVQNVYEDVNSLSRIILQTADSTTNQPRYMEITQFPSGYDGYFGSKFSGYSSIGLSGDPIGYNPQSLIISNSMSGGIHFDSGAGSGLQSVDVENPSMSIYPNDELRLKEYPNSVDHSLSHAPINFIYSDTIGILRSAPIIGMENIRFVSSQGDNSKAKEGVISLPFKDPVSAIDSIPAGSDRKTIFLSDEIYSYNSPYSGESSGLLWPKNYTELTIMGRGEISYDDIDFIGPLCDVTANFSQLFRTGYLQF